MSYSRRESNDNRRHNGDRSSNRDYNSNRDRNSNRERNSNRDHNSNRSTDKPKSFSRSNSDRSFNSRSDYKSRDFKKDSFKNNKGAKNFSKSPSDRGASKGSKTNKTIVTPHKHFPGVFTVRSAKSDQLCTLNKHPGHTVYSEKLVQTGTAEYRLWNPYRSKLGAGILSGIAKTYMDSKSKVLYLGAASGTSVSHVADICDLVFAVEFSTRSCRDLINVSKTRSNIIPMAMDARHPAHYRMLVPMCDVIFSDVAQPDQARIVGLNAKYFLKKNGAVLMAIKANCVDCSKNKAEVFASEVDNLRKEGIKPKEMVELEPYEKDHALVVGIYKGE